MATAPPMLSIDEYLHTSYKPDVHFVDGEIEERNLGEYEHSKTQSLILFTFMIHAKEWKTDAIVEQRIRVDSSRVRICDVAVLRSDAPRESVTVTPPLLCIEVLSPEDRIPRAKLVLADYFALGVPNIWLVDPMRREAFTFDAKGLQKADPAILTVTGTPISIDLTKIFAELD